jgi:6-phosphogluconolactonase
MVKGNISIFKTPDDLTHFLIARWKEICETAIKARGQFTAALPGGSTPVIFYQKLSAEKKLPWDKTHVFMVDERFVPYESGENNYHAINRTLLRHVAIPARNIHPILTSESSPEASAKRYEEDLVSWFKIAGARLPRFDLIVLGIGEDGHTASLFPGTRSLNETRRLAVAVSPLDRTKRERITITFPVINNAENVMFLATGKNKAKIVKDVIDGKNNSLPAVMVKPENGRLLFLLDESAGLLLKSGKQA